MEAQGLVTWLIWLLTIRAVVQAAAAYQSLPNKQVTAADAAKTFALEWRMEATAHVASLMVRDQQCKGDPANCDLQDGASDAIETLSKWAVGDKGWERLLSSVSLYAIARHAYQEAEYDEAIIALEESLALRLFAYADQKTLDRWQQGLVMPGSLFRRQKMDLANTLVLRSDCLVQLAREQRDVDDLTEAMELLQLATALLKGGEELIPDSVAAISRRAATIASVAAELLPQLKTSRVREVLEHHGISCTGCNSKMDYLLRLVPLLRLPVRIGNTAGASGSSKGSSSSSSQQQQPVIEAIKDPFNTHATALLKKPQEHVAQYMQRVFFRLLTLVPADYLAELEVACRRQDAKGRCISYLPQWVTAQAITIDKRTGMAHVSGPAAYAGDGGDSSDISLLEPSASGSTSSGGGSCGSASGAAEAGPQLSSEPLFVPGDTAAVDRGVLPAAEPHNRAGVELCGFLHIRAIPPGVNLPTTGGSLTPQQQKALKAKAAEGASSEAAMNTPFKGVYYYFYTDVPALVDRIINTFDPEEADFLFEQLDGLTAAKSLGLAGRLNTPQQKGCTEQLLLEGKAPATCSVLMPNIGSCARAPLKPPRRRVPMDPVPSNLGLPPTVGSYTPRSRSKVQQSPAWNGRSLGDSSNGSEDHDSTVDRNEGIGSSSDRGMRSGGRGRHRQQHHHSFPVTDRELSDRQLQEQMAKLARDASRRDRDDPLVPLTLAGCAVASLGLYLASKRRRRSGLSSGSNSSAAARLVLLGLGPGRMKSNSGSNLSTPGSFSSGAGPGCPGGFDPSGVAAGVGPPAECEEPDAGALGSTKQKRQVVAALRVAMNNTADTAKLEAALTEAEAADLGEAGLLQRARVLLDKRRKKDQVKAAAEKARLRAQKKDEARKGRKAKQCVAATPGIANRSSSCGRVSECAEHGDTEDLESDADSKPGSQPGCSTSASAAPSSGRTSVLQRLLLFLGFGSAFAVDAAPAADAETPDVASWDVSRTSSATLSRTSSSSACASAAAAAPGAAALQSANDSSRKQQGGSSPVDATGSRPEAAAAAAARAGGGGSDTRTCNSHPIQIGPTGLSVDEVSSLIDVPVSPTSPAAAAANATSTTAVLVNTKHSNAGSTNSKRSKGKDKGSNSQGSRVSGFQEVEEVPGWTRTPKEGAPSRPLVVKAVLDPFTAAAAKAASHPLLSTPVKGGKGRAKQAAAVHAAAASGPAASVASPAKRQEQQQQQQRAAAGVGISGVTAPVTPPATAVGAPAGTAGRGCIGGKPVGSAMHYGPHYQHQQQHGGLPAGWVRRSAASEDGSSSRPSTAGSLQQQGATTPSKPKLNPKATPYHPQAPAGRAAAGAGHPAAARYIGYPPGGLDWQQQQQQYAAAVGPGYHLPMRGASPVDCGAPGMMGPELAQYHQMGLMLNGSNGSNGFYHSGLGHQGLPTGLGPADATLDIGLQGNPPLMGYNSADNQCGQHFDQGLTSPNHHHRGVALTALAGLISPQQQQQYDRAGLPSAYQQMHRQQQLLELLSAAGPAEAAAYAGSLASAGGSAPLHLRLSSMEVSGAGAAAAAAHAQRSSYSSLPDYQMIQGPTVPHYAAAGFEGLHSTGGSYGQGSGGGGPSGRKGPGVLPLSLDDEQLPPGFSAEDYSTSTSELARNSSRYSHHTATARGPNVPAVPSPSEVPTTSSLGMYTAGSNLWAPPAATAASFWPPTLATTAPLQTEYNGTQHSYSRSQDLEVEVAAAATSANVAELVLGSSPIVSSGHVGPGAADAQMSKLAKEIMAIVAE